MEKLDLSAGELETVRRILADLLPGREVRAFGSRVSGKAKRFSDLDLAVMGETPLTLSAIASLEEAFSESDLPFRVDVVDWATASESFRAVIAQAFQVLQKA